jgi:hypothetical protein
MSRCLPPLFLAVALAAALAAPLAGQTQVTGIRDLNFGVVIRGVQNTVAPTDPVRSGQYYVRYVVGGRVQIRFTLPTRLNRVGGGGNMPIQFRNTDAVAQGTAAGSVPVTFNPHANQTFNLQTSPDFNVWLGGRVSPAANQATGIYRATVIMNVVFF